MGYEVAHRDDVRTYDLEEDAIDGTDMGEYEDVMPPEIRALDVQLVDDALGIENAAVKVWHFEPGDEVSYHHHADQEELYYVLEGRFSLKLGRSGDTEIVEVGPGTFYAAKPGTGHGHRCIGDGEGVILAIGAPAVHDPGRDPHAL